MTRLARLPHLSVLHLTNVLIHSQDPVSHKLLGIAHALPGIKILANRVQIWDVLRGMDEFGNPMAALQSWSHRKVVSRTGHDFNEVGEDVHWLLRTGVQGGSYLM